MAHVLLLSGSDYSEAVYRDLEELRAQGIEFTFLTNGSFEPRHDIFVEHLECDLVNAKETLAFMSKRGSRFDAVVSKSSEEFTPITALLAHLFGTRGPTPRSAFLCRSKFHMRTAFERAGLPTPRFYRCCTFAEIVEAARLCGNRCVAKPLAGCESFGAFLIKPDDDLSLLKRRYDHSIQSLKREQGVEAFDQEELALLDADSSINLVTDYIVEEFIQGIQISVDSLVQNGIAYPLGVARQNRVKPPYFVQDSEYMPYQCDPMLLEEIFQTNQDGIRALELNDSAAHVEIILTKDGPRLLEIACRIGGDNIHDAVRQTSGHSLFAQLILIALGEQRQFVYAPAGATAMKYYLPSETGIVKQVVCPAWLKRDDRVSELQVSRREGHHVSPPPVSFEHLGYLQVKGDTVKEAQAYLEELYSLVQWKIDRISCAV